MAAEQERLVKRLTALEKTLGEALELMRAWEGEGLGYVRGMEHTNWGDAWRDVKSVLEDVERHPCGHADRHAGCGGCDPAAIGFVREDGGEWKKVEEGDLDEESDSESIARLAGLLVDSLHVAAPPDREAAMMVARSILLRALIPTEVQSNE